MLFAGVVSFYASGSPDGLEKVSEDHGISAQAEDHALDDSPLADYGVKGVENPRLSGGLAGIVGVGVTFVLASTVIALTRFRRGPRSRAHE
nr:PDGLE domain-containing protein [Kineosporia babensis]